MPTCQEIVELVGCPECRVYVAQIQQTARAVHALLGDARVVADRDALVQVFRGLERDR